ncbi:MAG: YdcF family protein [Rhodospirillales bacterium]|nr:YdcF family protein [Rhodospirillales bacterium]
MQDQTPGLASAPDVVVILGAAMAAPGVPGPALVRRLQFGVATFCDRHAGHLLVSGGVVGPPPAEAAMMRDLALARGVPPERILVEDASRNTFENALFCGQIIRARAWTRVVVVTDAHHLPRALFVFRRLGLPVSGAGVPRPAGSSRLERLRDHLDERLRLLRTAALFLTGAHTPLVAYHWGERSGDDRSRGDR